MVLAQIQAHSPVKKNEELRNKPMLISQLIYSKGGKNIKWRKDNLSNKWCRENWTATWIKLDDSYHIYENKLKMD